MKQPAEDNTDYVEICIITGNPEWAVQDSAHGANTTKVNWSERTEPSLMPWRYVPTLIKPR